jgi:hypothetical protein
MSIKYVLDSSVSSVRTTITGGNGSSATISESQIKQVGHKEIRQTNFFMNVYGHVQLGGGARTIPSSGKVSLIHSSSTTSMSIPKLISAIFAD